MTTPRSRTSDSAVENEPAGRSPAEESPRLKLFEVNSERSVLTESGNTDGWIATDTTVPPRL